jgi:hypothetical protein
MDLMVLFFFCDFFWGLGMLKVLKRSLCGSIGLVVLSGLGSRRTHPDDVEGASMARRAPFPLSSIPAYIEHSIKLLCVEASSMHQIQDLFFHIVSKKKTWSLQPQLWRV